MGKKRKGLKGGVKMVNPMEKFRKKQRQKIKNKV